MPRVDIVVTTKGVNNADFTKGANGGASAQSPIEKLNQGTSGNNMVAKSIYANQLLGLGKTTLRSTLSYVKSNYGNYTGDYIGQTKIDNAFSTLEALGTIGSSVVMGAVSGGVAGAVVGAVVSVGSLAISSAQSWASYSMSNARINANASFNSARLGAILIDGSRG